MMLGYLDIVIIANIILGTADNVPEADVNQDGDLNILEIEKKHDNPLPPGRIWIESLDGTVLFLDDVNVCKPRNKN